MTSESETGRTITLRRARAEDAHWVWTINNHPSAREQSIHTADISWEEHLAWYRDRLARQDCCLFIGLEEDDPVGIVRFDIVEGEAVVSIAVRFDRRARGIGKRLIALVSEKALERPDVRLMVAYVRPTNLASQSAFVKNRYLPVGSVELSGTTMLRLERPREAR